MTELKVSRSLNGSGPMDGSVEKILSTFKQKIEHFNTSPIMQQLKKEEGADDESGKRGKVVLYTTSFSAVRKTYDRCKLVMHILRALKVQFTIKDVFLNPDYSKELKERMKDSQSTALPQLFIAGDYMGDGETVIEMNELGQLEEALEDFKLNMCLLEEDCQLCAGKTFVLCLWCKGSKKGVQNIFSDLKCTVCNQNGLQKCPECNS